MRLGAPSGVGRSLWLALITGFACWSVAACGRSSHGDDDDDGGESGAAGESPGSGGTTGSGAGGTTAPGTGGTAASTGGTTGGGAVSGGGTTSNGGGSATGGTSPAAGSANGGAAGILGDIADLQFLEVDGNQIIAANDAIVRLRGIALGNDVWNTPRVPLTTHHAEADFARLADWGVNVSRFYLNYQLFEDDAAPGVYKQSGFDYLDQNIRWAAKHGVRVIFNMHVPQGGFQSNGEGNALWTEPANQDRLVALWRAIAEHCRGIGAVAGYDFLNEPRPTTSRDQWVALATRLTSEVRAVDPDHMLVVERTNSVGDDWSNDASMNFFVVPDDNVVYEFHFYEPFEYTTQWASWLELGEGGKYPDESVISSANLSWYDWNYEPVPPPYAPAGDSPWTLYESERYVIDDPSIAVLGLALVSELNAGTVWFDDVFIDEYSPEGILVGRIFEEDLESLAGWTFWKAGATGSAAVATEASTGMASLAIANTDHDANLASSFRYRVKQGYGYVVGGYMKGQGISSDSRPDPRGDWTQVSRALIRLDYFSASGEVMARDSAALGASLDKFAAWGTEHNVPLFVGEFGLIHYCFEDGRGGTEWVHDMLTLLSTRNLHFTYHVFHEPAFGIFQSEASKLPDLADANQPLIDVFSTTLRPRP